MKRFTLLTIIAIMILASMNVEAKRSKAKSISIPYEKLVTMIAKETHWNEKNVARLGLKRLVKKIEREEYGTGTWFIYGNNVNAKANKNWTANLTSTGAHAFAIEVGLTTDNGTSLYFKEKADHDAFMSCARNSKFYERGEGYENIGYSTIESDEYINGWYVISFHGG